MIGNNRDIKANLPNVLIINRALIKNDGKILFVQRSPSDLRFPGKWELPGGKFENGCTLQENLKHEVMEEVGIEIDIIQPHICVTEDYPKDGKYKNFVIIEIIDLAKPKSLNIALSEEHSAYEWRSKYSAQKLELTDYSRNTMSKIIHL